MLTIFIFFIYLKIGLCDIDETVKQKHLKSLIRDDLFKTHNSLYGNKNVSPTEYIVSEFSSELKKIYENSGRIKVRKSIKEDKIEWLRDVDPFVSSKLKNNKLIVTRNKFGSQILEDPSYDELILRKPPLPDQRSLVIIFDGTGSMFDDLKQLTEAAETIINEITNRKKNPIYNYIFVPFRDPYIGPKLITQDLNEFISELRNLPLFGGGDCPESTVGGIQLALESALPKSFIFIFTDATAKDYSLDQPTIDLIQKHQASLTFLLTGFCKSKSSEGYKVYEKLASLSNGQIYNLEKTNIKEVLDGVKSSLDTDLIPLHYFSSNNSEPQSIDVNVDNNLKEFTVSIAGDNPNITINDPDYKKPKEKELINLTNLKVLNVQDPKPGKWNVKTKADSQYSVKLTALSDLNFKFGFSNRIPKRIQDTSINPILLMENTLSIFPSDDKLINNLTTVELILVSNQLNHENNSIFQLKRSDVEEFNSIYVTKEFQPPVGTFKIYVNGFDSSGNPLRHLLSTAIKAIKGESPRIANSPSFINFNEGEDSYLECKILSSEPIEVKWIKKTGGETTLLNIEIENLESNLYKLQLKSIQLRDAGTYLCTAENINGYDEKIFNVIVKQMVFPLKVQMMLNQMKAIENDVDYQISCSAEPRENVSFQWFFNGYEIKNDKNFQIDGENLILSNIKIRDSGNYTCVASNNYTNSSDFGHLDVLFEPKLLNPNNEVIEAFYGKDIELNCEAIGNPEPSLEWQGTKPHENLENGKISKFMTRNEDTYECIASNGIGKAKKKSFNLIGKANEPPYLESSEIPKIVGDIGEKINLICECSFCEPIVESKWEKIDQSGNLIQDLQARVVTEFNGTHKNFKFIYEIPRAQSIDSGQYTCTISNEIGASKKEYDVEIMSPPQIEGIRILNGRSYNDTAASGIEGSTIELICKIDIGTPKSEIQWTKNGKMLSNNSSLIINNLRHKIDDGVYGCLANNSKGKDFKNIKLNVLVKPKLASTGETVIMVSDGEEVSMDCDVIGNPSPTIIWKYFNQNIDKNDNYYSFYDNSLLFHAKFKDNGIYECEGSNEIGSVNKTIVLIVFLPPTIAPPEEEILSVGLGNDILLPCEVHGYPQPEIEWQFNDFEIELDESNSHIQKIGNLLLKNVNLSNEGVYNCEASNEYGLATKNIFLSVNYPPVIISTLPTEAIKLFPDNNVTLTCAADGNPKPEVFWNKGGERITEIGYGASLIQLLNAQTNISDKYSCVAHNVEGLEEVYVDVIAMQKPKINRRSLHNEMKLINGTEGNEINLMCPIDNANYFIWKVNSIIIPNEKESILKLKNLSYKDNGKYTCSGINEAGIEDYEQNLLVYGSPHMFSSIEVNSDEIQNIRQINLKIGENKTLKCLAQGFPEPLIQWKKYESVLSVNKSEYNLINVDISHGGEYVCRATNKYGKTDLIFDVRILVPPETDSSKKQFIEVNEGENIQLECSIFGSPWPVTSWLKNGKILEHEYNEILDIKNITFENRGLYKCNASNFLGTETIEFVVDILGPPKFKIELMKNDLKFYNNENIELNCTAQGNPLPILSWAYNNKILLTTSRVQLSNTDNYSEIYIDEYGNTFSYKNPLESFGKKDFYGKIIKIDNVVSLKLIIENEAKKKSGIYSCYALNILGNKNRNINVDIYVPPIFKDSNNAKNENFNLLEGLPLIMFCPWLGNPKPEINWFKNGNLLNNNLDITASKDNRTLFILNTKNTDSGYYECVAQNLVGQNKKGFTVEILAPPQIKIDNSFESYETAVHKLKLNQKIILECPAIGNPPPKVIWLKLNQFEDGEDEILLQTSNTLVLTDLQESGNYSCYVNNSLGFTQKEFIIEILKSPKILSNSKKLNFKELETITLECPAYGSPNPEITWMKEQKELNPMQSNSKYFFSPDRKTLIISNSKRDSAGLYSCLAKNSLGESKHDILVNIKSNSIWSKWEPWGQCSSSCGFGIRKRYRKCISFDSENNSNSTCKGKETETETCEIAPCPINGNWSDWSGWTSCSQSCWNSNLSEKPTMKRYRDCNNPAPKNGGNFCNGIDYEEISCNVKPCSVNGEWSIWEPWSECSVSCGFGIKERQRWCNNPSPAHGGEYCKGSPKQTLVCGQDSCPINGDWSEWSSWSECSQTCGKDSLRKRSRQCNNPAPSLNGLYCIGSNVEIMKCKEKPLCDNGPINTFLTQRFSPRLQYEIPENYVNDNPTETNYQYAVGNQYVGESNTIGNRGEKDGTDLNQSKIKMTITFKNYKPLKDLKELSLYPGLSPYVINKIFPCPLGFKPDETEGKCIDVNECESYNAVCGQNELCKNLIGTFECTCADGFDLVNGVCEDLDECVSYEHDCNEEQACLNTNGSYLCVPTPCPNEYIRDETSRQCILMCNTSLCPDNAKISQTITYTVLSLKNITVDVPFLKIVNYDVNQRILPFTSFALVESWPSNQFKLNLSESKSFLYLSTKIDNQKVFKIIIIAKSYKENTYELLYVTRFVVYLYIL